MLERGSLDFSFSGIKYAVKNLSDKIQPGPKEKAHIAASFQDMVFTIVKEKLAEALVQTGHKKLVIAGGVASNKRLRHLLADLNVEVYFPPLSICTDNGAMIAGAGYYKLKKGEIAGLDLNAQAGLSL